MTKAHKWRTFFNRARKKKNCICASDYPAFERMKFVCEVNICASGIVHCFFVVMNENQSASIFGSKLNPFFCDNE